MINQDELFTIIHSDSLNYRHFSLDLATFKDTVIPVGDLYIGLDYKFNSLYFDVTQPSSAVTFDKVGLIDETEGLTQSGFIQWSNDSTWDQIEVDGITKYYLKVTITEPLTLSFIGQLLLDEQSVINFYPEAVKLDISVKDLASTTDLITSAFNLSTRDLLNISETKYLAIYKLLSNKFFHMSDSEDDHYFSAYQEYEKKFKELTKKIQLTIDSNKNGVADIGEKTAIVKSRLIR